MGVMDEIGLGASMGVRRHRLTVSEYYRMVEVGLLAPDARVELIEGEMIEMAPIGSRHGSCVMRLDAQLQGSVGQRALVSVQNSVRLDDRSEPQPDLVLLRPRDDFYSRAHPTADDVLLLIEVADRSARYDIEIKTRLYAQHGIPEVWIIDLEQACVRFFRSPMPAGYGDVSSTERPGMTSVALLRGVSVDLSQVLAAVG